MSEPLFWRDRVNGKWYLNDAAGVLFEVTFTGLDGTPATFMRLERMHPPAHYEGYDERRSRPLSSTVRISRAQMEEARDKPGSGWNWRRLFAPVEKCPLGFERQHHVEGESDLLLCACHHFRKKDPDAGSVQQGD